MRGRARRLVLLLVLAGACPEGYRFALVPGEPPLVSAELEQEIIVLADDARRLAGADGAALALRVHCAEEPALCRRDPVHGTSIDAATCGALTPVFGFVHLSDVQLKEERIHMHGPLSEGVYDRVNGGAHRHALLERYDYAGLLALVLGINERRRTAPDPGASGDCASVMRPALAIHTGDSVDSGMFSELFEFLVVTHQLDVPLYNVVGNHDMLFYGTLPADVIKGLNVVSPFVPILTVDRFMRAHGSRYAEIDISIPLIRESTRRPSPAELPASGFHGFDLACLDEQGVAADRRTLCNQANGYYAFGTTFTPPDGGASIPVRFIMLNTFEIVPETYNEGLLVVQSRGRMREEQFLWLDDELRRASAQGALVFVAGHHPMGSFLDDHGERLERMLVASERVVAYLAGHTHHNDIRVHPRRGGQLWEIVGGSTLVHPQLALFIDLLAHREERGVYYLRVSSFRQQLGETGEVCAGSRLACLAARSRDGARADKDGDGDWRDEDEAKLWANGLLRVTVGREEEVSGATH